MKNFRGYTLVELVVAVGLFALVMTLVSGAYIMMIGITRQAQGTATGIDNLSFTLETMTRTIRTSTNYNNGIDCPSGCASFSVTNPNGITVSYALANNGTNGFITQNGVTLTDPVSVNVTSLLFYVSGSKAASQNDYTQPHVIIKVIGSVSSGPGKTQAFAVETSATMRSTDL